METFNITLPTSWAELTDKQLLLVYELFARDLSAAEVKTLCLMKWNRLKVLASLPGHSFIIKKKGEHEVTLSARQIQQATTVLDFLEDVLVEVLNGHVLAEHLHGADDLLVMLHLDEDVPALCGYLPRFHVRGAYSFPLAFISVEIDANLNFPCSCLRCLILTVEDYFHVLFHTFKLF